MKDKGRRKPASALVTWTQIANATGYRVFWGTTTRQYPYNQNVGSNLQYRITGLHRGTPYYFAAKSYNSTTTSPFSNEVRFVP